MVGPQRLLELTRLQSVIALQPLRERSVRDGNELFFSEVGHVKVLGTVKRWWTREEARSAKKEEHKSRAATSPTRSRLGQTSLHTEECTRGVDNPLNSSVPYSFTTEVSLGQMSIAELGFQVALLDTEHTLSRTDSDAITNVRCAREQISNTYNAPSRQARRSFQARRNSSTPICISVHHFSITPSLNPMES